MSQTTQPQWAVTTEKIQEAVQRIVEASRPLKVLIFGSQARSAASADSDLDLMVILSEVSDPVKESVRLRRLLKGLLMAVDVLWTRRNLIIGATLLATCSTKQRATGS